MQTYLNMEFIHTLNIFNLFTLHITHHVKLLHFDCVMDIISCNIPVTHLRKIQKPHMTPRTPVKIYSTLLVTVVVNVQKLTKAVSYSECSECS
jgi:hypothetical protein